VSQFTIQGGQALNGVIKPSGSKNAVLPILAATILAKNECIIKNVPDILDVRKMLELLEFLGAETHFKDNVVHIKTEKISNRSLSHESVEKMRASILFLGPMLARFDEVKMKFPGGCVIGKRSISAHLEAFKQLNIKTANADKILHMKRTRISNCIVVMPEMSVTATENIIMATCLCEGVIEIHLAACEPHVQELCKFLNSMGARISGIGTHKLVIEGVNQLLGGQYNVSSDYLEVGTLALASVLTKGEVTIENIHQEDLEIFWYTLWKIGAKFDIENNKVHFYPSMHFQPLEILKTAVHPGFPTDLQAPFAVLLTQCDGESLIFETLFEGRLGYLSELEQMGAKIQILNSHQAKIIGPTKLKGLIVASHDLRAGAAMVLAGLIAEGETKISNINYIDRGYEKLDEKLKMLGARIKREI